MLLKSINQSYIYQKRKKISSELTTWHSTRLYPDTDQLFSDFVVKWRHFENLLKKQLERCIYSCMTTQVRTLKNSCRKNFCLWIWKFYIIHPTLNFISSNYHVFKCTPIIKILEKTEIFWYWIPNNSISESLITYIFDGLENERICNWSLNIE